MRNPALCRSLPFLCLLALVWAIPCEPALAGEAERFALSNGDNNGDGQRDVSDAVFLLRWLFLGGPAPVPYRPDGVSDSSEISNGDCNGDAGRDIADASCLLNWLFLGGPPPVEATSANCRREITPPCSPENPSACLYRSAEIYDAEYVGRFELQPEHRRGPVDLPEEEFSVLYVSISIPRGAPQPMPVVLWSHGGGSRRNPGQSGEDWARALNRAGYATLAMHHMARSEVDVEVNICGKRFRGVSDDCDPSVYVPAYESTDRALDSIAVLDNLELLSDLAGVSFDVDRIAVAGHSGGTNSVLYLAGGVRNPFPPGTIEDVTFAAPDPRPIAFLPMSPPGAESSGWADSSLARIDRPVLSATGAGDIRPDLRIEPHEEFSAGDKYRLYLNHPDAAHAIFQLEFDANNRQARERQELYHQILASAAVAFLDAHLKDCSDALDWLESGEIAGAVAPVVQTGGIAPIWSSK